MTINNSIFKESVFYCMTTAKPHNKFYGDVMVYYLCVNMRQIYNENVYALHFEVINLLHWEILKVLHCGHNLAYYQHKKPFLKKDAFI